MFVFFVSRVCLEGASRLFIQLLLQQKGVMLVQSQLSDNETRPVDTRGRVVCICFSIAGATHGDQLDENDECTCSNQNAEEFGTPLRPDPQSSNC